MQKINAVYVWVPSEQVWGTVLTMLRVEFGNEKEIVVLDFRKMAKLVDAAPLVTEVSKDGSREVYVPHSADQVALFFQFQRSFIEEILRKCAQGYFVVNVLPFWAHATLWVNSNRDMLEEILKAENSMPVEITNFRPHREIVVVPEFEEVNKWTLANQALVKNALTFLGVQLCFFINQRELNATPAHTFVQRMLRNVLAFLEKKKLFFSLRQRIHYSVALSLSERIRGPLLFGY